MVSVGKSLFDNLSNPRHISTVPVAELFLDQP